MQISILKTLFVLTVVLPITTAKPVEWRFDPARNPPCRPGGDLPFKGAETVPDFWIDLSQPFVWLCNPSSHEHFLIQAMVAPVIR